jgi:Fic family protein
MDQLLSKKWFDSWSSMLDIDLEKAFGELQQMYLELHSFIFYTSVSVMASSKIEGEQMELDSYVKHKILNIEYLTELTEKPNDLYKAYLFAKDNSLNENNFHKSHKLLTAHLLPPNQRGVLRNSEMLVMEHKTGRIQYEATMVKILRKEYATLWDEIAFLLSEKLSIQEVFYFASLIHLVFVDIHPFADGNGRIGRLLEKWFLAEKLGERAWYIQSEKYYYNNVDDYYKNLARMGMSYDQLDFQKSIPFLLMLPKALLKN